MRRLRLLLWLFVASGPLLVGCDSPKLDPAEYGEVLKDVPRVKGSERLFPLPQLETPAEKPAEKPAAAT